jgi:hypothetical protein
MGEDSVKDEDESSNVKIDVEPAEPIQVESIIQF